MFLLGFPYILRCKVRHSTYLLLLPAQPFGVSATPPSSVLSADLPSTLCPLIHTTVKMLNRTGLSTEPWGMLLAAGLQLGFLGLSTTLQVWPFSQFYAPHSLLIQPILHQLFYKNLMWDNVKIACTYMNLYGYEIKKSGFSLEMLAPVIRLWKKPQTTKESTCPLECQLSVAMVTNYHSNH